MSKAPWATLGSAAENRRRLVTASWWTAQALGLRLRLLHGFRREGPRLLTLDDAIFPSFVRGSTTILAGWDNWLGYYFLAQDAEGEAVLERLGRRLRGEA